MVAIAAHIPSKEVGTGYFQETHPEQLFRECSHDCELVAHPRATAAAVRYLIKAVLSGRGGEVLDLARTNLLR